MAGLMGGMDMKTFIGLATAIGAIKVLYENMEKISAALKGIDFDELKH